MPGPFIEDAQIDHARKLAEEIVHPIFEMIRRNTTVSLERTVLRFFGISGAGARGVPLANLMVDKLKAAGVLNKGKGKAEQVAAKGTARASHAEKQAAMAAPGQPIGVSLPMCFDCYEYFRRYATARGRPVVVADPDMVRVFYPDGRVLAPSRTGTNPLGGAQP